MDGEELPRWFQPVQNRLHIFLPPPGIDGAVKGVLKEPVKWNWRFADQEIGQVIMDVRQAGALRLFVAKSNGTWRHIKSVGLESSLRPDADVVARAASRD